tara:strand:- start:664 stop:786 length:123 start_codon:yes stop_codon:yes gene_type:complete
MMQYLDKAQEWFGKQEPVVQIGIIFCIGFVVIVSLMAIAT